MDGLDRTVIRARGIKKQFGDHVAVDGIDLDVEMGEFFGILGPNGAGKSTTMRMLSCLSYPTNGELRVFGADPRRNQSRTQARIGVVPQSNNLDQELTVRENVVTYARYFGMSRPRARELAMEMLASVQLADRADSRVEALSGGMRRRLAIARALVSGPEILFLDEPTTGLDPQARHLLWERLRRLKENGTTLILTTHYMDEAEQLCDRLVIMDHGRIVAEGSPQTLLKEHSGGTEVLELRFGDRPLAEAAALLEGLGERIDTLSDRILVYTADAEQAAVEVQHRGLTPSGSLIRRASLEDVFLHLTGRTLVEAP